MSLQKFARQRNCCVCFCAKVARSRQFFVFDDDDDPDLISFEAFPRRQTGINTIKPFCHNWTAIKLRQDFDALFYTLNGFASINLNHQYESVLILSSKHKYVHLKSSWASHTMHQNLAIILQQFNEGKNSFIVLILVYILRHYQNTLIFTTYFH